MNGILLFNKPLDWTSHDAVAFVRSRLKVKAGHAGTLDPKASGLLLILVNDATRHSSSLTGLDKDYRGTFELGKTTDTQDLEGVVTGTASVAEVNRENLEGAMKEVASRGMQIPPIFSALKRDGKKLHRLARQLRAASEAARAAMPVLEPRPAVVYQARLESFDSPHAEFFLNVAKGFYVRTFCHDVGKVLGCGAVLTRLVRTRIGPYHLEDACGPNHFGADHESLQRFFRPAA